MSSKPFVRSRDLYTFPGNGRTRILQRAHAFGERAGTELPVKPLLEGLDQEGGDIVQALDQSSARFEQLSSETRRQILEALMGREDVRTRRKTDDFEAWLAQQMRTDADFGLRFGDKPVGVVFWGDPSAADANLIVPFANRLKPEKPLLVARQSWVETLAR